MVDSLNKVTSVKELPFFIFNPCLENSLRLRNGFHDRSGSVRWRMLQKVTNKNALKLLLQYTDPALNTICPAASLDSITGIANFDDKSFDFLAKKRYEAMK